MKTLHVIATVNPNAGGPIAGIYSGAMALEHNVDERHILCFDAPDAPWVVNAPLKVFALGQDLKEQERWLRLLPWLRYGYTPGLTRRLRDYAGRYEAVVVHGLWNYASFGTWRALRNTPTPYFVFTHGMLDPWFNQAYPVKTFMKRIFWKLLEHKVLRDARGVMFTCEEERLLARQSFTPYRANEYVVGYGAREPEGDPAIQREAFLAKAPEVRHRKFALFLSRIHRKKGIDLLIEGFARIHRRYPDLDLVIAGPDASDLGQKLRKLADDLGVSSRIHWLGMLTGDAKWGAFRSSEFFVLPSHQENFGIVVAEALSMRKPVLITNKVNIWREIENDKAGIVVNDDVDSFTEGLIKMSALSAAEISSMGEQARKSFTSRFDMAENSKSLQRLLSVLSRKS